MNPALTGYDKRCLYVTFDLTPQLRAGRNAVGVVLSNGRFFAPRSQTPVPMNTYGYPKLIAQLHCEYDRRQRADDRQRRVLEAHDRRSDPFEQRIRRRRVRRAARTAGLGRRRASTTRPGNRSSS